jgi:O-antigen/teichoic acid export membrane protein
MEEHKKFTFDVGWAFLSSAVTLFIGFILSVVIARWLGANDLGLYRMTLTIYGIVTLVATFGFPSALIKYIAEYKEDEEKLNQTTSCSFINAVIIGLIAAIAIFFLAPFIADIFKMPELSTLLKITAIAFPFASLYSSQSGLLTGLREMRYYAVLMAGHSILMCILIVTLVLLGFGVEGAISGLVISVIGACFLGSILSKKFFKLSFGNYIQNTKKILSFGGKMFTANAIGQINYHADIILIGFFLTATQVGYYSIAVALSRFFWIIPQSIQTVVYPAASEYWRNNNHAALQTMIDKSMKYTACALIPIGLGVGFFARDIITMIYGQEFIHAVLPLLILIIGTVIHSITKSIGGMMPAVNRPDLAPKKGICSASVNIALNILLIPRFGITGAAIATTCSLVTAAALHLFFTVRLTRVKINLNWFAKIGVTSLIIIIVCFFLRAVNYHLAGIIAFISIIAIVWIYFLSTKDKEYLLDLIKTVKLYFTSRF